MKNLSFLNIITIMIVFFFTYSATHSVNVIAEPVIFKVVSETENDPKNQNVPEWVKNNAGWWSEGLISTNDFVEGLQFLINKNIVKVPPISAGIDSDSNEIPEWVKNNAGWWSEGLIETSDFVRGIQFLIEQGIIMVSSVESETIVIQGSSDLGSMDNSILQGFLAGTRIEMDIDLVKELKPRFWRIGDFNSNSFVKERFPGVKTEILLSEMYEEKAHSKPWKNWDKYEQNVKSIIQYSKDNSPVDYFDVWSEPDGLWSGTYDQFFEMIKRTHNAIRSVEPDAKIVGPGSSYYNEAGYEQFLDFLVVNNLHFDAISWHEFNIPEEVPKHVASARSLIDSRPSLGQMEIQINEFSSGQHHLIPGWAAGWIYYLDKAQVDWVNRACWEREVGDMSQTSECIKGLNGIFAEDERTPQAIYWVHKFYADMKGTKLDISLSNPKIVALASKDENTEEIQVLVGRYSCGQTNAWCTFSTNAVFDNPLSPVNLEITLSEYPYDAGVNLVKVTVEKIPFSYGSVPLPQPIRLEPYYLDLENEKVIISLAHFEDGEVVRLFIEPVKQ